MSTIGRMGGLARMRLYGNPGTAAGRRRGGLASLKTHALKPTRFKTLRPITIPPHSKRLAELIGIFMGDGHVGTYQASLSTNSETDVPHAFFVQSLIQDLFHVPVRIQKHPTKKAYLLITSSKTFCDFLATQGIPRGNKIRMGVKIPHWIQEHPAYFKACVRGLFDTDGCVYVDTHHYKGRVYKTLGMAFANQSLPLLEFFKQGLERAKLRPTQKTDFRVFLRRREDIERYFKVFGSSNEKHLKKARAYFRQKGGVA